VSAESATVDSVVPAVLAALPDEEFSAEFDQRVTQRASTSTGPVSSPVGSSVPSLVLNSDSDADFDDDAMFRPPSNPAPGAQGLDVPDASSNVPWQAALRGEESTLLPPASAFQAAPLVSPSQPQRVGAVRAALPPEHRSPAEEEATVLGQRRVVAPIPPAQTKRQLPLAWIALIVTALIGGLMIAFYPGKKSSKPKVVLQTTSVTATVVPAGGATSLLGATNPPVDPLPRVSASSPQQLTVTEKLEDTGEFSLAEIRWTDGTPPLVAAYVAFSKQGGFPTAKKIEDAASKRAVIVGIDPKSAYCFWVVALDTAARPIVQYRSEQQCVRGGVPYNFEQQAP
jgi:hypothetical protein